MDGDRSHFGLMTANDLWINFRFHYLRFSYCRPSATTKKKSIARKCLSRPTYRWYSSRVKGALILAGKRDFALRCRVRTDAGSYSVWYPAGTRAFSPEVKRTEREADHSTSSCAKKEWRRTSTLPYVFMTRYLISTRDSFYSLHSFIENCFGGPNVEHLF